jgi:AraC-like DNA-binding protein
VTEPAVLVAVGGDRVAHRGGRDVLDLAALAAQAGYADQAHLTRECGQLAGLTPAALVRQRSPG